MKKNKRPGGWDYTGEYESPKRPDYIEERAREMVEALMWVPVLTIIVIGEMIGGAYALEWALEHTKKINPDKFDSKPDTTIMVDEDTSQLKQESTLGIEVFMEHAAEVAKVNQQTNETQQKLVDVLLGKVHEKDSIIAAKDSILEVNGVLETSQKKQTMLPIPGHPGF